MHVSLGSPLFTLDRDNRIAERMIVRGWRDFFEREQL
jgi:hypothetical protein